MPAKKRGRGRPSHILPFPKARALARSFNLRSSLAYYRHVRTMRKRLLPVNPAIVYAAHWKGWADFLGPSYAPHSGSGPRQTSFPSFAKARELARRQGLSSGMAYREWVLSQPFPRTMPLRPDRIYSKQWISWADFLGQKYRPGNDPATRRYPEFEQARKMARKMGLKNSAEYIAWARNTSPRILPSSPSATYATEWRGWADFLGPTFVKGQRRPKRQWPSFQRARAMLKDLKLKTGLDYTNWLSEQPDPKPLPMMPRMVYGDQWKGWQHFLSYDPDAQPSPILPFEKARKVARGLALKNSSEYRQWRRRQPKPCNLPSEPAQAYSDQWKGWADFLGHSYAPQHWAGARRRRMKSTSSGVQVPSLLKAVPVTVPKARRGTAARLR